MTVRKTKSQLLSYLANNENRVIALTGKWGTGKSYLWNEIKAETAEEAISQSLYVSLFGVKSIERVKLLLMYEAIGSQTSKAVVSATKVLPTILKGLESFRKEFSVLNDVGAAAAPFLLKGKLVVIDDIERKHKDLDVDEVLGFIDQYSQTHGTRFILVLNNDKLADRGPWDQLREKVIDQELQLRTSPAEAFDIANSQIDIFYSDHIKKAVEVCGICNIRIIRKILKGIALIFGHRPNLRDDVLVRIIPSTVVLGAIHFKGLENGPSFDYVLSFGAQSDYTSLLDDASFSDSDPETLKWGQLLGKLGIVSCDRYEYMLKDFFESGLLDPTVISEIIDGYDGDADRMHAALQFNGFQRRFIWDHRVPYERLLEEGKDLASQVEFLDAQQVSILAERLCSLEGGNGVAQQAMQKWLEYFRRKNPDGITVGEEPFWGSFRPEIRDGLLAMQTDGVKAMTVLDACLKISADNGWGHREEVAFKTSTVEEFEEILRNCPVDKFHLFMYQMMRFVGQISNYEAHFGSGIENFVQACRKVCRDANSTRLKALIEDMFKGANQLALLGSD